MGLDAELSIGPGEKLKKFWFLFIPNNQTKHKFDDMSWGAIETSKNFKQIYAIVP